MLVGEELVQSAVTLLVYKGRHLVVTLFFVLLFGFFIVCFCLSLPSISNCTWYSVGAH